MEGTQLVIERIRLKTFQTHQHFNLVLDPCVTMILGPNGAGKSTLVRALKWLALNQPSGKCVCSWESDSASVTAWIDGHKIIRRKDSSNQYLIDGKRFAAIGTKVPDEVRHILKLEPVNFQDQLEPPFWFLLTPGQVGKELNRIINLSSIDRTMHNVGIQLRQGRTEQAVCEQRLQEARLAVQSTCWAVPFSADLDKLTKKLENCRMPRLAALRPTLADVSAYGRRLRRLRPLAVADGRALALARLTTRADRRAANLTAVLSELSYIRKNTHTRLDVHPMSKAARTIREITDMLDSLAPVVQHYQHLEAVLCPTRKKLAGLNQDLRTMNASRCPLCGRKKRTS
jgi:DNA repair exonuclease SbcCD ATPase subunit